MYLTPSGVADPTRQAIIRCFLLSKRAVPSEISWLNHDISTKRWHYRKLTPIKDLLAVHSTNLGLARWKTTLHLPMNSERDSLRHVAGRCSKTSHWSLGEETNTSNIVRMLKLKSPKRHDVDYIPAVLSIRNQVPTASAALQSSLERLSL